MIIGMIACSDGLKKNETQIYKYNKLLEFIKSRGIEIIEASAIFRVEGHIYSGTPEERADELNKLMKDDRIEYIFDVSGGDSGNEILEYIDYETAAKSKAVYCGYSDLSVVINALYSKSGKQSVYYNIWNIIDEEKEIKQRKWFEEIFIEKEYKRENLKVEIGELKKGIIVGGNLRCFSKIIGTEYLPDCEGRYILIEAWSGNEARLRTYLYQMKHAGIFKKAFGIMLGNFTELEKIKSAEYIYNMAMEITGISNIVKLGNIGHNNDAYAIIIG